MLQRFATVLSAAGLAMTVAACSQSDSGITNAVKAKLAADDTVKASEISVDTDDGVVTLRGNVKSMAEADKASAIARQSSGVKRPDARHARRADHARHATRRHAASERRVALDR